MWAIARYMLAWAAPQGPTSDLLLHTRPAPEVISWCGHPKLHTKLNLVLVWFYERRGCDIDAQLHDAAVLGFTEVMADSSNLGHFTLGLHDMGRYMRLDAAAQRALNVMKSRSDANDAFSLYGLMNRCKTVMGKRLLKVQFLWNFSGASQWHHCRRDMHLCTACLSCFHFPCMCVQSPCQALKITDCTCRLKPKKLSTLTSGSASASLISCEIRRFGSSSLWSRLRKSRPGMIS